MVVVVVASNSGGDGGEFILNKSIYLSIYLSMCKVIINEEE